MKMNPKIAFYFTLLAANVFAHSDHDSEKSVPAVNPLTFAGVRNEMLTDPELKDFQVESSIMTVAPGGVDPIAHRHDGELFGYVLKGSVQIALGDKPAETYNAGQMFYEKRNVLHALTKNPSKDQPAEVLLVFIIKQGRARYTLESPAPSKP